MKILNFDSAIATVSAGTASVPSISFAGDPNTGIYSPGADQVAISTGGSGKAVIEATGRLGLGTMSPGVKVDIVAEDNTSLNPVLRVNSNNVAVNTALAYDGLICSSQLTIGNTSPNPIIFNTNSTERARIDSSGRLLVGTSSARNNFYNATTTTSPNLQLEGTTYSQSSLSLVNNNTSTVGGFPMLIMAKSAGSSVGSNTAVSDGHVLGQFTFQGNDGSEFVVGATISAVVDGTTGANDLPTRLEFSTTPDSGSNPVERLRIGQNGQISFFTSGNDTGSVAGINFYISGGAGRANWFNPAGVTRTVQYFYYSTTEVGSIAISSTATAYNTSSDYRLKENVTPVTDGITRLQQLKPSRFNFIADPTKTVDGFLAHEVQTIVPEAITGEKDAVDDEGSPVYQGIDQSKLVPLLTAALQEAIGEIESLKARVAALEAS